MIQWEELPDELQDFVLDNLYALQGRKRRALRMAFEAKPMEIARNELHAVDAAIALLEAK